MPSLDSKQTRYVWSPRAKSVRLNVNGKLHALTKTSSGWWIGESILKHLDDYTFVIDGKRDLPDPRSPWQPYGARGPSRFFDHDAFLWSDANWRPAPWEEAILYELHTGTFTAEGTFDAAIERLHHLSRLGVTHIELLPVGQFPGDRGWGYDGVFPFAAQNTYGGPEMLKRFVNACHRQGLAVLLDVVYNHLGPSGNVLPEYGPYLSKTHSTPWGPGLNYDAAESDEVRRYVCDNALMWLRDYHIDGLRIDSAHEMADSSAVHILEELLQEVGEFGTTEKREFILIAEDGRNNPKYAKSLDEGGLGFDAQWSNDFGWSILATLTGERGGMFGDYAEWRHLVEALTHPFVYEGQYSEHRRHRFGRPAGDFSPSRFIIYNQNHDLTGNRQTGDRLGHLTSAEFVKIASALTLLSPFTPMIFQGEEWNTSTQFQFFADCDNDPTLSAGVEKGRRLAADSLGWNVDEAPDACNRVAFEASKLDWRELESPEHLEVFDWYQSLIKLRKAHIGPATLGSVEILWNDEESRVLAIRLGSLVVACNLGSNTREMAMERIHESTVLMQSGSCDAGDEGITLAPASIVIIAQPSSDEEQKPRQFAFEEA